MGAAGGWRYLRCRQERGNQFQDVGIIQSYIVEAGRTDENDPLSVEDELIRDLNLSGAWFRVRSNARIRTAGHVDKLGTVDRFVDRVPGCYPLEVFPLLFAPMTL